jgi:5-methyltetrahydrofolate--homocysteine methyltransferase
MALSEDLALAVQRGKAKDVETLVTDALANGVEATDILNSLLEGMHIIGERFKKNEAFVPEVLISARALNKGTALLKEPLKEAGAKPLGKVVLGTAQGDLHDIGKNLVRMMLEGAGFEVIDLGVDVAPDAFVEAIKNEKPAVVAISALLTTTMPQQATTIEAISAAGLRDQVKIMVGGAPVTQAYSDSIGADGYSADAASAADLAKQFVGLA